MNVPSGRAILIGILCTAAISVLVAYAELVVGLQIGFLQLPPVTVGFFLLLLIGSRSLGKVSRRLGLHPTELATIYCMVLLGTMVSSRGLMERWLPTLVGINYYASPTNGWQHLFFPHIKSWMVPFDVHQGPNQAVARGFFEGLRPGESIPWQLWWRPLLAWGLLIFCLFSAYFFLAALLYPVWSDQERINFPLAQLPLALVRDEGPSAFLSNKLTWLGFLIPALVLSLNGLHTLLPSVPEVTLQWNLEDYLVDRPWNGISKTPVCLSFAALGLFYFLSSEFLFSLWFFLVLTRLQEVIAAFSGIELEAMPLHPTHLFIGYQAVGAYVVLAGYLLWRARPRFQAASGAANGRRRTLSFAVVNRSRDREVLPFPIALCGLAIAVAFAIAWCILAGMSWWLAALEIGVALFVVALIMGRSTAECGLLMTETTLLPVDLCALFAPVSALGASNLTPLSFVDAILPRDQRGQLLCGLLDGLSVSDGVRLSRRKSFSVFAVAVLVAIGVGIVVQMLLAYHYGHITLYYYPRVNATILFQIHGSALQGLEKGVANRAFPAFGLGIIVTVLLLWLRAQFAWWPLHPLGYALAASWTVSLFWFPCMLAWVLKVGIVRYGGLKVFNWAKPFFLGLILGESISTLFWLAVSGLTGSAAPHFPWIQV